MSSANRLIDTQQARLGNLNEEELLSMFGEPTKQAQLYQHFDKIKTV
jgi:hypothetical protein